MVVLKNLKSVSNHFDLHILNGEILANHITDPILFQGDQTELIEEDHQIYVVHYFTNEGNSSFLLPHPNCKIDILIVGGGAGGLIFRNNLPVSHLTTLSIGKGGDIHQQGENSSFGNLVALGGGYGGNDSYGTTSYGGNGGSGGGGGPDNGLGGIALQKSSLSRGFGNNGGKGHGFGEGGGGAGFPGKNGCQTSCSPNKPGDGGDGLYEITINSKVFNIRRLFGEIGEFIDGESWFAGGGSGGGEATTFATPGKGGGGIGGFGDGSNTPSGKNGKNGKPNTGGGGGGGNNFNGGKGGSGIIIIRYSTKYLETKNFPKKIRINFLIYNLFF